MKKNYSYPVSSIGFTISELPGETAVYIEFSGCRQNCPGCHSDYLIGDQGDSLNLEDTVYNAYALAQKYPDDITAIVLMGGTANNGITEKSFGILIKALAKKTGLPIGLYSGRDEAPDKYLDIEEIKWVKTGSYKEDLGGLEEPTTNQRFYVKEHTIVTDQYGVYSGRIPHWVDMTKQFQILKGEEIAQQPNSDSDSE